MCLTFHRTVAHFFGMPKRKSIYTKYLCLLSQTFFSQTYVIWASKLDGPKICIPLSKWTQNTPCNYSSYSNKRFYEIFIRLLLTNHGSSTFCFFTHLLLFVFLIMNKIYLNRWKQNSRDISNCNI